MVGISVCLAGWFLWTTILGAGYENSCDGTLCAELFGEYVCKALLPRLVLKEPCFHSDGGLLLL